MKKMKVAVSSLVMCPAKNEREAPAGGKKRLWWWRVFYIGTISGVFAVLTGLLTGGLAWLGFFEKTPVLKLIGTWLVIAAFPLVIFGAHAMDKITEIDRNEKRRVSETEQNREGYLPEQWKE